MSVKLNGGFVRRAIIRAIIIAIYNAILFVVPFEHHATFWWSYSFGMVALIAQWLVTEWTMGIGSNVRSKFYGFPVARVGWIYLFVQMPLSAIFIIFGEYVETWVIALTYLVLFLLAGAGVITMDLTRSEIIRQDEKLVKDTAVIRTLTAEVTALSARCYDNESQKAVAAFAEVLKYSDPVSGEGTRAIEESISACVYDLELAVDSENKECILSCCQKAGALLNERNQLCKLGKIRSH